MKASEWLKTLPEHMESKNNRIIYNESLLDKVYGGHIVIDWETLKCQYKDSICEIRISTDMLQIGEPGDSVRVSVSAKTQTIIADWFGCILPTPIICDRIHEQAIHHLTPNTETPDQHMGDISRMFQETKMINDDLAKFNILSTDLSGIRSTVGKDWVLTKKVGRLPDGSIPLVDGEELACNYGWHVDENKYDFRASGKRGIIQSQGYHHSTSHFDYSQMCRLVYRKCNIDGQEHDLKDMYQDVALSKYISHEGPIPWRLPGVVQEHDLFAVKS